MAKPKPNYFLALQIDNKDTIDKFREVQFKYVKNDYRLKDSIVSVQTAHVTIEVFRAEENQLEDLKKILKDALKEYEKNTEEKNIVFKELGMFSDKVLYAKPESNEGETYLHELHKTVRTTLKENGFQIFGHDTYNPHSTLLHVKVDGQSVLKGIPKSIIDDCKDIELGIQEIKEIQLLSMDKEKDDSGYYHCEDVFKVSDR